VAQRRLSRSVPAPIYRAIRSTWRALRLWLPQSAFERRYDGLPGPVHVEDHMLPDASPDGIAHYRRVGREAYTRIGEALEAVGHGWNDVATFLDFGCGHGRVLRWIRTEQPHIALTAADVNRQAVAFCHRAFGARALALPADPDRIRLDGRWDVIWLGSVLTHIDEARGLDLLGKLASVLEPGGVLVFTTHGELIPERVPEYGDSVGRAAGDIRIALDAGRSFFVPGDAFEGATTFHARDRLRASLERVGLPPVLFRARGWDNHQDVWAVRGSADVGSRAEVEQAGT